MYDFYYNYIKTKYGDNAKLLFTGTDSFAYEINTKDFNKDINPDIGKRFNTRKVLGMFKDGAGGKQNVEFVGLRANLYSYTMLDGSERKKM